MTRGLFRLFDESSRQPSQLAGTTPQSLTDISSETGEQSAVISRADRSLQTELRVDYSDFSNHVFLNSALNYFNITGEKILGEYPYGGSRDEHENFIDSLDGYQRYVLSQWPKRSGHLLFRPTVSSSYVQVDDVGNESGVTKTGLLNPGTGSWSVELWYNSSGALTGSSATSFLAHKDSGDGKTLSLFLSGSSVFFRVVSGALSTEVSAAAHVNTDGYVLAVIDRSTSATGTLLIYTGSISKFPRCVSSSSISFGGSLNIPSSSLYIGSGTLSAKQHVPYSGKIDEVRVWRKALAQADVTSSFNRKLYAQDSLMGMWRFNETGSSGISGLDSITVDSSGHKLNGRIKNYWSGVRGSGSLVYETSDPIMDVNCRETLNYIIQQQESGSDYDRNNHGKITDMFPQALLGKQDNEEGDIASSFLFLMGRYFDQIKLYADHLQYALRVNESEFDQAADAKLDDVARFFGWELPGGFSGANALQYLIGRDVQAGELSNEEIDSKLYDIKIAIWRRLLSNLSHFYKTKGTRESVRSIMNAHGIPPNIFRLKEYGSMTHSSIREERIKSEMSTYSLLMTPGLSVYNAFGDTVNDFTIEQRVMWPVTSSLNVFGSVWEIFTNSFAYDNLLTWTRDSITSQTGTLDVAWGPSVITIPSLPIFDGRWYNISLTKDTSTATLALKIFRYDDGEIVTYSSASDFSVSLTASETIDDTTLLNTNSEVTVDEFRVWRRKLNDTELHDHTLNYRSVGIEDYKRLKDDLLIHWRLDDNDVTGNTLNDFSGHGYNGSLTIVPNTNPFVKHLNKYSYIGSPDFSWSDDKVRVFSGNKLSRDDTPKDSPLISLEMNMTDQLNEDISTMMSSMQQMNDALGHPAGMYRHSYDLLDRMRTEYFRRMTDRLNFRVFIDMLDLFDRSFVSVIRKVIPARAVFFGDEVVVESHMLERPKIEYPGPRGDRIENVAVECSLGISTKIAARQKNFSRPGPSEWLFPTTINSFFNLTTLRPDAIWIGTVSTGSIIDTTGNGNNLAPTGSPQYLYAGPDGTTGISYGWGVGHRADVANLGSGSFIYGALVNIVTDNNSSQLLLGRINATSDPCCIAYIDTNTSPRYPVVLLRDSGAGTVAVNLNTAIDWITTYPREWLVQIQVDRVTVPPVVRARISAGNVLADEKTGSMTGVASLSGTTGQFGFGHSMGAATGGSAFYYGYYITGSQCTGSNALRDLAVRLGYEG